MVTPFFLTLFWAAMAPSGATAPSTPSTRHATAVRPWVLGGAESWRLSCNFRLRSAGCARPTDIRTLPPRRSRRVRDRRSQHHGPRRASAARPALQGVHHARRAARAQAAAPAALRTARRPLPARQPKAKARHAHAAPTTMCLLARGGAFPVTR